MTVAKAIAFAAALMVCAAPVNATIITLHADMTGAQETSPTPSLGSGTADVTFDTVTHMFSWTVSFAGPFLGTPTAMHFHGRLASDPPLQGAPGSNAGVRISLGVALNPNVGSVDLTTLSGYGAFMDQDILDGLWYVNLHSTSFPGGEIRGQLLVPEPVTCALMGLGLVALAAARRPRVPR
jgi:hypothetical protein